MKAALGKAPAIQVFGTDYPTPDGTCIRDYIHIEDLAAAHLAALQYLDDGGDTTALNVGTGIGSSVLQVIEATERISGVTVPTNIVGRRAGDPVVSYADPTKVRNVLGWKATRDLDQIIASAWEWHSSHPDGFDG
jgi:UDP-glucose 4-epimerase